MSTKTVFKLEYKNPEIRSRNEVKSKLLKPESNLYRFLTHIKNNLRNNGFEHKDRMDLHTEVLNSDSESLNTFLKRVESLEGTIVDVKYRHNYQVYGRAVGFRIGRVDGYKYDVKITLAYFDNGKERSALTYVLNNLDNLYNEFISSNH